jgi:hypothetical protein
VASSAVPEAAEVDEGLNSEVALTRVERQLEMSGLLSSPVR